VHQASAFDGDGARRYAGRWHHKGQSVVYTAATQSLAALEILVHVDSDLIPNNFIASTLDNHRPSPKPTAHTKLASQ
jgi:RES domain-containing protein